MIHRPGRAAFPPRDGQPEPTSSSGHDRRSYTTGWDTIPPAALTFRIHCLTTSRFRHFTPPQSATDTATSATYLTDLTTHHSPEMSTTGTLVSSSTVCSGIAAVDQYLDTGYEQ